MENIYTALKNLGCKMDNHESDLYVKATKEAQILTENEPNRKFFMNQIDKTLWIELPFRYLPWWEKRQK